MIEMTAILTTGELPYSMFHYKMATKLLPCSIACDIVNIFNFHTYPASMNRLKFRIDNKSKYHIFPDKSPKAVTFFFKGGVL